MPLPRSWVDALFAKLSVRYGEAFLRQYGDAAPELVKEDWADVLDGFQRCPEAIAYGLRHLPVDRPPNALQFRALCNNAPPESSLALPRPVQPIPPHVRDRIATMTQRMRGEQCR